MILSDEMVAGGNDIPLLGLVYVCECEEPDTEADGDEHCIFEVWLDRPLVSGMDSSHWYVGGPHSWFEDFAYDSIWQKTCLRDKMNNDRALWDARPYDYLDIGEQLMATFYAFSPDYVDWKRLRSISRDEWHAVVQRYYELMYQIDGGAAGSGRRPFLALKDSYPAKQQLLRDWCPDPNPLHERRRGLYPQIDDKY